jgi:hypothetical protein
VNEFLNFISQTKAQESVEKLWKRGSRKGAEAQRTQRRRKKIVILYNIRDYYIFLPLRLQTEGSMRLGKRYLKKILFLQTPSD